MLPETGSSTIMYIATRLPNGLASCAARYTDAFQRIRQQWRLDLHRPDLRPVRAEAHARLQLFRRGRRERRPLHTRFEFRVEFLKTSKAGQALRARFQPIRARRIDRHARRQRHRRIAQRGLGQPFGVEPPPSATHAHQPSTPSSVLASGTSGATVIDGGNSNLRTAGQRQRIAGRITRNFAHTDEMTRFLVGVDRDRRLQRSRATGRQRHERPAAFAATDHTEKVNLMPTSGSIAGMSRDPASTGYSPPACRAEVDERFRDDEIRAKLRRDTMRRRHVDRSAP